MKKFYSWSYENVEHSRVLHGGTKALDIHEAREKIIKVLNLEFVTGKLTIKEDGLQ